jgi:hypothetical protein
MQLVTANLDGAYGMHWGNKKCIKFLACKNLKARDNVGDPGIHQHKCQMLKLSTKVYVTK